MGQEVQLDNQEWLTTSQVVERYNVAKSTVHRWSTEKKVTTKKVHKALYISGSSIDSLLERQKEEKRIRDLAFTEMRKSRIAGETPVIDYSEIVRLRKQVQNLTYENGRLKGELKGKEEAHEKQLDKLNILITNLAKK